MNEQDTHGTRLAQVLDDYLAAREAGSEPDVQALLVQYPELADDLRACLASLKLIGAAATKAKNAADDFGAQQVHDWPAQTLGDFQIVRELGRGGMGVVYEARQLSLGRRVALKVLPFAGMLDARQLQRFKNEAQAAAQLDHPNIVDVIAVGCERGVHYYAMRFIEGQSLAEVIAEVRQKEGSGFRVQKSEVRCQEEEEEVFGLRS